MTEGLLPEVVPAGSQIAPLSRAESHRLRSRDVRVVAESGRAVLLWFAIFVVYGNEHLISQSAVTGITTATLVWLVTLRSAALAARLVLGSTISSSLGTAIGLVVVAALNPSFLGLHVSFGALLACGLAVFCSAVAWDWFVERTAVGKHKILVIGTAGLDGVLAEELRTQRRRRFDVVEAIPGSDELAEIVEAQQPDIVVLTDEGLYDEALDRLLDLRANVRVAGYTSFVEYAFGRVPIDRITAAWFMSLFHPRQRIYARLTKRTFDVLVAALGLVLAAPFLVTAALLTKTSSGPILYRQTRVGENGAHFTMVKLRTMRADAERHGAAFSKPHDPRVTRVGLILRSTHLDELPQLWNVLKGDMSIVGPRPERPEFIEAVEAAVPFWNRRLLVKPGLTGWAQVRGGYASDCEGMAKKLSYDLWYLRHRSLLVDLAVCVTTLFTLFARPLKP